MNVGIVGCGNMGRTLGRLWARAGHEVAFGSRDRMKAGAAAAAARGSAPTWAGRPDDAAAFGDAVLYTVGNVLPRNVLDEPRNLAGKIVIDCTNSDLFGLDVADPLASIGSPHGPSLAERLAEDVPGARVVKAFNTIPAQVLALGRKVLTPHRISAFVCSDDVEAKAVVGDLAEDLGLVAVDSGGLQRARLVETVGDFVRYQIIAMRHGPLATISLQVLSELAA